MKIYAKSREYDKVKLINSYIGKDIWVKVWILGDTYYAKFLEVNEKEVLYNSIASKYIDDIIDFGSNFKRLKDLCKQLDTADTVDYCYLTNISIGKPIEVYTTEEIYDLAEREI